MVGQTGITGPGRPIRRRSGLLRGFLVVLIGALTVGALFAVGVLLFGRFGELEGKVVGSTMMLGLFSLLGMAAALRIERRRAVWLGWIGMGASALGYAVFVVGIWMTWPESRVFNRIATSTLLAAMACALLSLLLLVRPSSPTVRRVMGAAILLLGVLWAALEALALWMPEEPDERLLRGIGAVAILAALAAILTPILERMSPAHRRSAGPPTTTEAAAGARPAA